MKDLYRCPKESRSCVRPSIFYLNFTASLWELTNPSATIKEWILPCYPVFGLSRRFCQDMTSIIAHFWPKLITWHPWDIWEITVPSLDHNLVYLNEVKVTQSCPTFCDPMDCIVYGVLQVRILEWVAFPFSKGRGWTQVSRIAGGFFTSWATREAFVYLIDVIKALVRSLKHEVQSLPAHCWPQARPGQWFYVCTPSSWYVRETSPLRSFMNAAGRHALIGWSQRLSPRYFCHKSLWIWTRTY